jgi:NitT/TauT family transport system substrate-binding protein
VRESAATFPDRSGNLRGGRIVRLLVCTLLLGALVGAGMMPRADAQELSVVRIGMTPVETEAGVYYAEELGLFRKAGISIKIQNFSGGAAITAGVVAGDLDVGAANPLSFGNAFLRGIPVKAIASGSLYSTKQPQSLLVIAPDRPTPKAADLNGKIFCGVSVGGMDQLAVDAWMDKMGGDASTIKFVEMPPSAEPTALAEGRVDACVLAEPVLSAEIAKNQVKPISKVYGIAYGERFSMALFFASNSWLAANPALAKRFVQALTDGQVWASSHPKEAAVILEKYTKLQLPQAQMIVAKTMDPAILQPIYDAAAKYKLIPRPMNAADVVWKAP